MTAYSPTTLAPHAPGSGGSSPPSLPAPTLAALDGRLGRRLEPILLQRLRKRDERVHDGAITNLGRRVALQRRETLEQRRRQAPHQIRLRRRRTLRGAALDAVAERHKQDAQDAAQRAAHLALHYVLELVQDGDDGPAARQPLVQRREEVVRARLERLAAVAVAHDHVPLGEVGLGARELLARAAQHRLERRRVRREVARRVDDAVRLGGRLDKLLRPGPPRRLGSGVRLPVRAGLDVGKGLDVVDAILARRGGRRHVDDRDGKGRGVERGLERAAVDARRVEVPVPRQLLQQLVDQRAHLEVRHAAKVADQEEGLVARRKLDVRPLRVLFVEAVAQHLGHELLRRGMRRDLAVSGLVVRARSDLDLVRIQHAVLGAAGDVTVVEGGGDGDDLVGKGGAEVVDVVEGVAAAGRAAHDLEHADLARQPAAADQAASAPDRDVVAADQHPALGAGLFRRQAKVQTVARVVGDDEDGALVGRDGGDSREDLLGGRAGKDVARHRGGQHVGADIAGPGGLVS
ncbi:hypothetical protein PoMZ_12536 [Pyricularia oryzae]|uniref:Uncharacterized protein n=1 Tax=Pyricularia oryzae TaxID=318829 RepID=A0A4P7NSV5_PYROR|nr:hypothetical protein PoMZ_12536 [Pyricularia oryzae]